MAVADEDVGTSTLATLPGPLNMRLLQSTAGAPGSRIGLELVVQGGKLFLTSL